MRSPFIFNNNDFEFDQIYSSISTDGDNKPGIGQLALPKRERTWDWIAKALFVGYVILLTLLLLVKDPIPGDGIRWMEWIGPVAHLISFCVLGALAFVCRWRIPGRILVLGLVAYATITELLQGLVGWRSPEWIDWVQDLAGIAIGAGCVVAGKKIWKSVS